jgi:hypothetical protein
MRGLREDASQDFGGNTKPASGHARRARSTALLRQRSTARAENQSGRREARREHVVVARGLGRARRHKASRSNAVRVSVAARTHVPQTIGKVRQRKGSAIGLFGGDDQISGERGVGESVSAAEPNAASADDLVDIILIDAGSTPNAVHAVARQAFAFDPPNAKEYRKLLGSLPQRLCSGVPRARAEALKVEFAARGGAVELVSPDRSSV